MLRFRAMFMSLYVEKLIIGIII